MTSERAFWKALGMGTIITLAVWGALFLAVTPRTPEFFLPYILCALVTLAVVVPFIFRSYRREGLPLRKEKPQQLVLVGIVLMLLGVAYGVDAYVSPHAVSGWRLLLRYGAAFGWVIAGFANVVRALRLRRSGQSATSLV